VPSTTTDPHRLHRAVLAVAGPQALADITADLSDADTGLIEQILAEYAPTHLAVLDAVNPDGSIRDQAAFDALCATAGQDAR
jgi:hypothetical protein